MNLDEILLPPAPEAPKLAPMWCTVETSTPLTVRPDGATAPLPGSPVDLVGNLAVGDRVWCVLQGTQLIAVGVVYA